MLLEIFLGLLALFILAYGYMNHKWRFWPDKGVYQIKPSFPFGGSPAIFLRNKHLYDVMYDEGEETKGLPFYGSYFFTFPMLILKDVDLVKQVLVKDFEYFGDRISETEAKMFTASGQLADKLMVEQMTLARGDHWKNIR